MGKIVLFGVGGNSRSIFKVLRIEGVDIAAFCVDSAFKKENVLLGKPVFDFEDIERHCPPGDFLFFAPTGFKNTMSFREKKYLEIKSKGYSFFSFFNKTAVIYTDVENIGENCFVAALSGIDADVILGNNVFISGGALIGHDTVVGDNCFIGAGAIINGGCKIGKNVFIGAGCAIKEGIVIPDNTTVGMGVDIHRNIQASKKIIISPLIRKIIKASSRDA